MTDAVRVVVADDQRAVRDGLAVLVGLCDGTPAPSAPVRPGLPDNLTPREVEVLTLIGAGLSNGEIGERLVLGQATVKTHVNRIFGQDRRPEPGPGGTVRDRQRADRPGGQRDGRAGPRRTGALSGGT